jgi:hypothetical protein
MLKYIDWLEVVKAFEVFDNLFVEVREIEADPEIKAEADRASVLLGYAYESLVRIRDLHKRRTEMK